jgi:hypothetical protein
MLNRTFDFQPRQSNSPDCPAFRQRPGLTGLGFMHQVIEDMLDHYRIFNTGYRLHGAATDATGLDVDNTLEPLRSGHRGSAFGGCWRLIRSPGLVTPAPLCRHHQRPVLAAGRKHPMKPGKILHTRLRHQRCQPGYEIQRFKDDMVFCRIPVLEDLNTTIYTY